jgi:hypothetical protein
MGVGRRAAALAMALLLAGCTGSGLDEEQSVQERRTCASLRERVAARALDRFGILVGEPDSDDKLEDLDPRALAVDPERFYATLEQVLADAPFGAVRTPTSGSPASRLVETCRSLG